MAMLTSEFWEKFNAIPIEKPAAKRTFNIALGDRNADRLNSAVEGDNWHINVRDLTASLVKKGVSDRVIQALAPSITLPGYDTKQTEDELRKFTTSAKEKGFGDAERLPFDNQLDGFNLISIGDLSTKEFAPIDWLLEPFLPRPSLTLIAGPPKVGKSWLCLFFALQIASHENEVIYLANEDNERRLKDRINSICLFPPDGLHFIAGLSAEKVVPKGDAAHDFLRALVSRRPATKCVIVDTLAAIRADVTQKRSRDEYSLSEEEFSNLRKLAHELGITLILVHHTRKANENDAHPVERILGSQGIAATVETIMVMKQELGSQDIALHVTGKDVEQQELCFPWERPGFGWPTELVKAKLGPFQSKCLAYIKDNPRCTQTSITEALGCDKSQTSRAVDRLLERGLIIRNDMRLIAT